jgi:solute carrier family 8 (sodium/calcium exchanger)
MIRIIFKFGLLCLNPLRPPKVLIFFHIHVLVSQFYSGDLGPSTIVGSAAFNLLIIIAVCIIAIPPGDDPENPQGRKIADMGVFSVTCTTSVFAYIWLIIILVLPPTPDICTFYEGFITFLFFPILVLAAYAADRGWFTKSKVVPAERLISAGNVNGRASTFSQSEFSQMMQKLDATDLDNNAKAMLMISMAKGNKPSRAQLRMQATRMMTGGKSVVAPPPSKAVLKKFQSASTKQPAFFFGDNKGAVCSKYAVLESQPNFTFHVMRHPAKGVATIKYKTEDITAKAGEDYEKSEGTIEFADGESTKDIVIKVFDDDAVEEDEKFNVIIYEPSIPATLEGNGIAEVTIVDDDEPGEVGFDPDETTRVVKESSRFVDIPVKRINGSSGTITVKYRCEEKILKNPCVDDERPALDGTDYESVTGQLTFGPGEIEKKLRINILDDKIPEPKQVKFDVILYDCVGPVGGRACLTDHTITQFKIVNDENTQAIMDLAIQLQKEKDERYTVETETWADQFHNAFEVECEEGENPSVGTLIMHYITLPWKVIFAIVPPTKYGEGWVCFCVSLMFIGVVTGVIGDLASLFGCAVGMPDATTAITLVALGTSLPDTFASKAAALSDDTADAAIGNVTGSNAVNVFLGLGLPWLMASAYWDFGNHSDQVKTDWSNKYKNSASSTLKKLADKADIADVKPVFAIEAGSLGPSVGIFVCCALTAVAILVIRRRKFGMELGGPQPYAYYSAVAFTGLWFLYVGGSIFLESQK